MTRAEFCPLPAVAAVLCIVGTAHLARAQTWLTDYDEPEGTYQALFDLRTAQGYRPVHVTARQGPLLNRFEVIWSKGTNTAWRSEHDLTSAAFQALNNTYSGQNYRLLCLDILRR